jgi:tetratricopeptide (TPR) repeat protein
MARGMSRKELLKQDEFTEKGRELGQWIEENWRMLVQAAAVILVVAAGVSIWIWQSERSAANARALMARGADLYRDAEEGGFSDPTSLNSALALFEEASDTLGSGDSGRLARYYRGAVLYRLGRADEALALLDEAAGESSDSLSGAALSLRAMVLAENGQLDQAIEELGALIDSENPAYPADQALMQLGRLHSAAGNETEARRAWQRVMDEYPQSNGAMEAARLLGS